MLWLRWFPVLSSTYALLSCRRESKLFDSVVLIVFVNVAVSGVCHLSLLCVAAKCSPSSVVCQRCFQGCLFFFFYGVVARCSFSLVLWASSGVRYLLSFYYLRKYRLVWIRSLSKMFYEVLLIVL